MMTGAVEVLNAAGCALVGGHTGEGRELALGFAVNGVVEEAMQGVMRKSGMRAGDALVLTKPLGTGTLFAAHARLLAQGRWIQAALQSMQLSSQAAGECLREHGVVACTDVTGFGLLGHLLEMADASCLHARIDLSALPLLDGAQQSVEAGITSSLQDANLHLRHALRNQEDFVRHPRYPLLFDPQTAGGLLASVAPDRAGACVAALRALGYGQACVIGEVLAGDAETASLLLAH
jgi:selenide,water dikinase